MPDSVVAAVTTSLVDTRPIHPLLASFTLPRGLAIGDGRPHIPASFSPAADPTATFVLQPRDLELLGIGGWVREFRGDDVCELLFHGSRSIFSRRLGILDIQGLVRRERLLRNGNTRGLLTAKGRDLLVEHGVMADEDIFQPRSFLPLKDMAHGHLVAGLSLLLDANVGMHWNAVWPSWLVQRRLAQRRPAQIRLEPAPESIPDVLAARAPTGHRPGRLWAFEVDLGGERLKKTLLPRIAALAKQLISWSGGADCRIAIFTRGPKRLVALKALIGAAKLPVEVRSAVLPSAACGSGLSGLRGLLNPAANSFSQATTGEASCSE
jgi:hypothetical protein